MSGSLSLKRVPATGAASGKDLSAVKNSAQRDLSNIRAKMRAVEAGAIPRMKIHASRPENDQLSVVEGDPPELFINVGGRKFRITLEEL